MRLFTMLKSTHVICRNAYSLDSVSSLLYFIVTGELLNEIVYMRSPGFLFFFSPSCCMLGVFLSLCLICHQVNLISCLCFSEAWLCSTTPVKVPDKSDSIWDE
ncbi:hypothetical protein IscW_ISCW022481 [Ixodes scapularis]|uniref:Uncharacterized protein n=1 Tax=Ixodes scapularis TaxID=6945 RepID=B7QCI1_IXOSC|nr:hypothetical protein IscW_ISCW022481 [Ixodes scapularis]|eukprot:XP_002413245.1 hypothetical protein IscW_ISCW022481 [Ixodes scapularis]